MPHTPKTSSPPSSHQISDDALRVLRGILDLVTEIKAVLSGESFDSHISPPRLALSSDLQFAVAQTRSEITTLFASFDPIASEVFPRPRIHTRGITRIVEWFPSIADASSQTEPTP